MRRCGIGAHRAVFAVKVEPVGVHNVHRVVRAVPNLREQKRTTK